MPSQIMLATSSHSPIIEFPAVKSDTYHDIIDRLNEVKSEVEAFDPDLVVIFGVDHYGGHHMYSMPPFCIGVEATALADVGGTPGPLPVPRDIAVRAVEFLREDGVDVAVSYAMDVDHGFTQALVKLTGGIDRYPVLPIFVSCIQPPFVPFARMRALGESIGRYIKTLDSDRVLIIGTGGLSHNPRRLFRPSTKYPKNGCRITSTGRHSRRSRNSRGSTTRSKPTRSVPRFSQMNRYRQRFSGCTTTGTKNSCPITAQAT